jgi:hypothetical protein
MAAPISFCRWYVAAYIPCRRATDLRNRHQPNIPGAGTVLRLLDPRLRWLSSSREVLLFVVGALQEKRCLIAPCAQRSDTPTHFRHCTAATKVQTAYGDVPWINWEPVTRSHWPVPRLRAAGPLPGARAVRPGVDPHPDTMAENGSTLTCQSPRAEQALGNRPWTVFPISTL